MSMNDHPDERERLQLIIDQSYELLTPRRSVGVREELKRRIKSCEGAIAAIDADEKPAKILDPYLPYILDKAYKLAEHDPAFLAIIIAAKAAFAEQLTALMEDQRAKHPVQNLLWKTTSVGDSLHGVRDSSRASD